MEVTIISVERLEDATVVAFTCSAGRGRALWQSTKLPQIGDEIAAEFDIDSALQLESNAWITGQQQFAIRDHQNEIRITGFVEGQDDDGMLYYRLASDCLIMAESETIPLSGKWLEISIDLNCFRATPIGN